MTDKVFKQGVEERTQVLLEDAARAGGFALAAYEHLGVLTSEERAAMVEKIDMRVDQKFLEVADEDDDRERVEDPE